MTIVAKAGSHGTQTDATARLCAISTGMMLADMQAPFEFARGAGGAACEVEETLTPSVAAACSGSCCHLPGRRLVDRRTQRDPEIGGSSAVFRQDPASFAVPRVEARADEGLHGYTHPVRDRVAAATARIDLRWRRGR